LERVLRGRGSSPGVSSNSHNSNYGVQAGVSRQSRQRHLLHLPGSVLRLVEDKHNHSRLRGRGVLQFKEIVEREQQAHEAQVPIGPQVEAFVVYLRDLRNLPGPKIRRLRSVPEEQWFPRGREECDPRFWTILQESFYGSYVHRGSQLSQHRMLQFTTLRIAAAGEPILPYFDYLRGLADLVSRRSRYVPD
jgi:hypothetical protein